MTAQTQLANATRRTVNTRPIIVATLIGLGITGCSHYTANSLVPEQTGVSLESLSLSVLICGRSLKRVWDTDWPSGH